jgi:DNA-binding transcriptional ArsR family regulator
MHEDTQVAEPQPPAEHVDLAVELFRMLSDPTRVRLLWALAEGERPVNELAAAVGKASTAVSQHLAKLRMARLVQTRRQANQVFYRVTTPHVTQLVTDAVYHAEHDGEGVPAHHRAGATVTDLRLDERWSQLEDPGTNPVNEEGAR